MKRFTQISNEKTPKKVDNLHENLTILVEKSLNISIEGELEDYMSSTINIEGKEKLVEQLSDFIDKITKENSKLLLEKVKYQGFKNVEKEVLMILERQTPSERRKNMKRVEDLLEKGKDFKKFTERQSKAIKSGEKAYYRAIAAENTIGEEYAKGRKKDLMKIYDIFLFRSKQLGFKK